MKTVYGPLGKTKRKGFNISEFDGRTSPPLFLDTLGEHVEDAEEESKVPLEQRETVGIRDVVMLPSPSPG